MTRLRPRAFLLASPPLRPSAIAAASGAASPDGPGTVGPNDTIVLGFIGVGGMGTGLLNIFKEFPDVGVAAVCDVYEPHRLAGEVAAGGKPDAYGDFRGCSTARTSTPWSIATPDHWHAIPTILACQAGKDVYCEKPLAYRIAEGRAMVEAADEAQARSPRWAT